MIISLNILQKKLILFKFLNVLGLVKMILLLFKGEKYMNKMDGKSMDVLEKNIEKLKEIFPEVVVEGEVDLNKIRQMFTGGGR